MVHKFNVATVKTGPSKDLKGHLNHNKAGTKVNKYDKF